ncbi:hypothetical protein ACFLYV_00810 [Chloroflexota bacterium]
MKQFTYDYYRYFLEKLLKKYKFISFNEGKILYLHKELDDNQYSHLIMRHDIDMDLSVATALAKVEMEYNIKATYFILLKCPIYNVFSKENSEYIEQIIAYGHRLGLHFDASVYTGISIDNIESLIDDECDIFMSFFKQPLESISFHRPGPLELSNINLHKYPNTYENMFIDYFSYFSDSRSKWARGNPLNSTEFHEGKNLHLCLHPVWWSDGVGTPFKRLTDVVDRINARTDSYLKKNCIVWEEGKNAVE